MSETVNQENNATTNEQPKTEEKLFTQDEVNGFFNNRYSEMMAKLNEYEGKAKKYDELEEANKTELQKATERAEKLEAELASMKKAETIREVRSKVATETGVPANLLTGETEEDCKAQANAIMSFAKPVGYPSVKDGGEIQNVAKPSAKQQFAEWANQVF